MKFFIDTANLEDIKWGLKSGFIKGVTTNPSLLSKEPKANYLFHIGKIVELMEQYVEPAKKPALSLSVEVFSDDPEEIIRQSEEFVRELKWPGLAVKVHISRDGKDNLALIYELFKKGIKVNCTACMTTYQAMAAAAAGARYVSLFWGRIRDGGLQEKFIKEREQLLQEGKITLDDFNPATVVKETRMLTDRFYPGVEIIAGSMRTPADVKDAALSGAHIITVPPKILRAMLSHFKTDEVVDQFFTDFQTWMKGDLK